MGIRITNQSKFALYDSVSGFAFGPTFGSEEEAETFLNYIQSVSKKDLRLWNDSELEEAYGKFIHFWESQQQ